MGLRAVIAQMAIRQDTLLQTVPVNVYLVGIFVRDKVCFASSFMLPFRKYFAQDTLLIVVLISVGCLRGFYNDPNGTENCLPCPVSTYQPQDNPFPEVTCTSCSVYETTITIASTSYANCTCELIALYTTVIHYEAVYGLIQSRLLFWL